jgi:hypothetical protein
MQSITSKFLSELDSELTFIKSESTNKLHIAKLSIQSTIKFINKLKVYILKYKFKSQTEEITFFKTVKPLFVSRLIHHTFIYNTEVKRPHGCSIMVRKFLNDELETLHQFYKKNLDFYKYYRSEAEHLDHKYFLRCQFDLSIFYDSIQFEYDPKFSTHCDYLVAQIMANVYIEDYIKHEIQTLDNLELNTNNIIPVSPLNWTGSKTAVIELLYALHADGCFNNGNVTIKQIATTLESAFNIDLGHYSRTLLEIRGRKTGKTKYLDNLQEKLLKKLNDTDDEL